MRTVPLHGKRAAGRVALVDEADYDLVMQYRWTVHQVSSGADRKPSGPYAICRNPGDGTHNVMMHALIMGFTGIEHADGDTLNNQRSNLRKAPGRLTNFRDRTGERYGKLVVVRRAGSRTGSGTRRDGRSRTAVTWLCICDCGNEKITTGGLLNAGHTTSCGCARRVPRPGYQPPNTLPPGRAARNRVLRTYRRAARDRSLSWELTEEEFDTLVGQDCTYCGCPPSTIAKADQRGCGDFIYNGLDRKDNTIGYVPGNVLPCCSVCNHAKKDMSYDDFTSWIARLTRFWTARLARGRDRL